jgi:hypothetical protein
VPVAQVNVLPKPTVPEITGALVFTGIPATFKVKVRVPLEVNERTV